MPQKILRLGLTEFSLLFMYWLNKYKKINNIELINFKKQLIKWLYSTSGYYDTTIQSTYMDAIHTDNDTETYNNYMETMLEFIKNPDIYTFCFHCFHLKDEMQEFKNVVNPKKEHIQQQVLFDFIQNKKILIISPFSPLIKQQLISGNCKKIYDNTPDIDTIYTYTFPYTFFNKGPHNNILETADCIYNEIITTILNDYDSVLISCGAYSCLMAKKFYDYGKNVCTLGGDLQGAFGILNSRTRDHYFSKQNKEIPNEEYWITEIPDIYKPKDYMKIENGCYW
jgi:hypothetical protein